jgi:hypothetical protein
MARIEIKASGIKEIEPRSPPSAQKIPFFLGVLRDLRVEKRENIAPP